MSFNDSVHISGFVLIIDGRLYGPFDSPDVAAKWMIDSMGTGHIWRIEPLHDPEAEK